MNKNHGMKELQEIDFAIQEVVLFLDTHPNHEVALSYYRYAKKLRERKLEEVEKMVGPLTNRDCQAMCWDWINNPWPWERED